MKTLEEKLYYKPEYSTRFMNMPQDIDLNIPDEQATDADFILSFSKDSKEVSQSLNQLSAPLGDKIVWIAYPKQSGNISSDLNRDVLWDLLTEKKLRPVSQISLNQTWSAIRIKPGVSKRPSSGKKKPLKIPEEVTQLLSGKPQLKAFFNTLSNSNKREYIEWITGAKKAETKTRRLASMIDKLSNKKKNPFEN